MFSLTDVWIRPGFGGKGRKMTGQLEAHSNGFRYTTPKNESLDIMYRCALLALQRLTALTMKHSQAARTLAQPVLSQAAGEHTRIRAAAMCLPEAARLLSAARLTS